MRHGFGPAAALLLAALAFVAPSHGAERPPSSAREDEAVLGIRSAIQGKDCTLAVKRLNEALPERYPDVLLMAGAMYEHGLCLKPNWDRAARMYKLAHDAGHQAGALRLIVGYALPGGQPSAALWWASKHAPFMLPPDCRSGVAVVDEVDAFAATLMAWPAQRLLACNYVVGVQAALAGELQYPSQALDFNLNGEVVMDYVPAQQSITWRTEQVELVPIMGVVDGDATRDRSGRAVQRSFERHLAKLGETTLQRFPKPEGVDPTWRFERRFVFTLHYR